MPPAEKILWYHLKGRQIKGYKFRRQFGIGDYIVDFYCPEAKLVIEIDGDSHYEPIAIEYDRVRENNLQSLGLDIIRFTNLDVYQTLDEVIKTIHNKLPNRNPL